MEAKFYYIEQSPIQVFLHIGIGNTAIYLERKLSLTIAGKGEEQSSVWGFESIFLKENNLQNLHLTEVSHWICTIEQNVKNILAKVKDREVLMFLQSCVWPCQQLQQSHPKSTEFQKSLTYLLHWKIIPWKKHRIQRQAFVAFLLQTIQQNMKKTPHQTKTSKPQTKTKPINMVFLLKIMLFVK